jgi:hypothetical protein
MTPVSFAKSSYSTGVFVGQAFMSSANQFMFFAQILIKASTTYQVTTTTQEKKISIQDMICRLREDGLPLSVIADIVKVERKSVYSWLGGAAIKLENQERLETLYNLLFIGKQASLLYLYRYWNKKILAGLSLRDLLMEKVLDVVVIRQALHDLWPMAKKYEFDLMCSYAQANEDEGQNEAKNDWKDVIDDGIEW